MVRKSLRKLEDESTRIMNRLSRLFKQIAMKGKMKPREMEAYFECNYYLYHYCNKKKLKESYLGYG